MKSMDEEKKYRIALSTHQKIGARTFAKLYKRFKKLEKVWQAGERELFETGLDRGQIEAVREVILKKDPDKEQARVIKNKIEVLILSDSDYPKILKEIPDPPGILYVKGKILPQDEISLAVVGSRKYSNYEKMVTQKLVYPLSQNNLTIISGLALGIDAFAHQTALDAKSRTIGIFGLRS